MKQRDLQPCAICKKGVMHSGQPFFYRLDISQMIVDLRAVQRQHGLEMMLGAAAPLGQVLGPNDDMAKPVSEKTLIICADCALATPALPIACLLDDDGA